jgi:parallel beta-helix repeat protein
MLIVTGYLAVVLPSITSGSTVAYWRFEEGPAEAQVAHPVGDGVFYPSVVDSSGNGNHLSVWTEELWAGYEYKSDVAFSVVGGANNMFSVKNTGAYPAMFTETGAAIQTIMPAEFTIEATFKLENSGYNTYKTIVGRDSRGSASVEGNLAALYFQGTPYNGLAIRFCDVAGYFHIAEAPEGSYDGFDWPTNPDGLDTPWYSMAAVSDGSTLSLYLRNVTAGDSWKLIAETDIAASGSPNTALTMGTGDGIDWDAGNWSVGRGLWAGVHDNRAYGFIDEVRISDSALRVSQFLVPEPPDEGKVIYVDDDGPLNGDGSSWIMAYRYLQDGLVAAQFGDEIRVGQGIYRPDETSTYPGGTGDRYATFQLINGVILKGGYAGNGQPDPDMRDFTIYETILSGDLSGNDVPVADPCDLLTEPTRVENSLNVVTGRYCNNSTVLDGFTITGGNANGSVPYDRGSGMLNDQSNSTVSNCTFTGNFSDSGGAMYNDISSPALTNCTLSNNSTNKGGGAINNWRSSPTLTNCKVNNNWAGWSGGGICNVNQSNPTVTICTFINNSAGWSGGGMENSGECSPIMTNCIFSGNSASDCGGGLSNWDHSNPTATNCTFSGNWATNSGGGMINWNNSNPTATNCTFSGNSANWEGGGMTNMDNSNPALTNCILWGNTASSGAQIHKDDTCFVTITYSDIQGGWLGTGNIEANPCFADSGNGDCHLKSQAGRWNPDSESWIIDNVTSPCIDVGDPDSDWRTELWPHGCRINMGAYGGTAEASMSLYDAGSVADLNIDGQIGGMDTKLLIDKWLVEEVLLPEDLNRDGKVNFADYAIFAYIRGLPSTASNPYPTDRAIGISPTADLNWTAVGDATSYDVYFGTNNPPPFIGNQSSTIYDPDTMDYSTTYYWRIDTIGDAGKTNGLVWSFATFLSPPPPPP